MRMSGAAAVALLGVWLAAPAAAQTVDDVVARHVAARGGEAKLEAIQTIKLTRTVGTPFTKVNVTISRKRPNLLRIEQGAAGQPPVARGVNADAAWDMGAGGKVTTRTTFLPSNFSSPPVLSPLKYIPRSRQHTLFKCRLFDGAGPLLPVGSNAVHCMPPLPAESLRPQENRFWSRSNPNSESKPVDVR